MVKKYYKNLFQMFKGNALRLVAISLIVAVGIAVATGVCGVPSQIKDALKISDLPLQEVFIINEIADKVKLIGNILPPFFIAISTLTALTTIIRLIDEERQIFACYKTLGYSNFSIINRYMFFCVTCTISGCAVGIIIGNFLLRPIIFNVTSIKFDIPNITGVYLTEGLLWSLGMLITILLGTLIISILRCREKPAELLRPKSPKDGKKIFLEYIPFFWKRLKFKFKSSIRNIFRFKGRLIMTVFSIAGSTIMLFAGLGLISSINSKQNENVQKVAGFMESMNAISAIITLCGVVLAVLVLLNLTNINIEERKREIATLKVLGYKPLEVAGFIYREILILSVFGIIIGLPLGYYFVGFIFNYLDFGSLELIEWYVWVGSTAIAIFSVILADVLLYRKINKIEMIASLKSIE